ncbi:NAD-dependent epimerase/dehydratase family protein [Halocatena halophila]|uniref:NAD-dependent epimerase/dehydratase family protein n=1 Tax=Halocatena halophila TaxID=2814576 RepID=UPI002ED1B4CD
MNVLVTGGCGYIGSVLLEQLRTAPEIERIVVLDDCSSGSPRALLGSLDSTVSFVRGDVRDRAVVDRAIEGCETVIHLAAVTGAERSNDRREHTLSINRDGTETVLAASGAHNVSSFVLASSCNVYGAIEGAVDERTTPNPLNPYAESKLESESLLVEAGDTHGFETTALRLATNYGLAPGIRFNLVVNRFVFQALTGSPITVYGDGTNWRPFIHVEDAARAYAHAAIHPDDWEQPVYNVGDPDENYQIKEIASLVDTAIGGCNVTYLEDKQPGPSYNVRFDQLQSTGFVPKRTLRDGIAELATAFQATPRTHHPTPQ